MTKADRLTMLLERLFMILLVGVCAFGVKFLADMSTSLHCLNERVAVLTTNVETVLQRIDKHAAILARHEDRIDTLESSKTKPPEKSGG